MIERFEGIIQYDPYILCINIILMLLFMGSWAYDTMRYDRNISFWRIILLYVYFVTFLVEYPFINSELNIISIADSVKIVQSYSNQAYLISFLGFICIGIGGYLESKKKYIVIITPILKVSIFFLTKPFVKITKSSLVFYIFYTCFIGLSVIFLTLGYLYNSNNFTNPREYVKLHPSLSLYYDSYLIFFYVCNLSLLARFFQYSTLRYKLMIFGSLLLSFTLGVRTFLFQFIVYFFVVYVIKYKKSRISFIYLFIFAIFGVSLLSFTVFIRNNGSFNSTELLYLFSELFYGNTFSDYRDFAWLLGSWNGEFYQGKTYIAAFLTAVPFMSSFKNEWLFGHVTVNTVGISPLSPGLRPGLFGEAYFNFGIVGVIFIGILWGYFYKYISNRVEFYAKKKKYIDIFGIILLTNIINNLACSAGFFQFYVILFILFVFFIIHKITFSLIKK